MDPGPPVIRLAVFGKPVARSLSPRIHRLFARQLRLRVDYRAIEATPESFPEQVRGLAASGGRGCNVTVPLKHVAWSLAARCSDNASRAQAANTLVFNGDESVFADNTDGPGLVNDLLTLPGGRLRGARVCVLGAGGAAAGILGALLSAQPACVIIANRTVERARELARRHADLGRVETCGPAEIGRHGPFDLLINATSEGHRGGAPALSHEWFSPGGLCYDLNYGPAAAPLQRICSDLRLRYADGLGMLVGQAALSFALWTGQRPDAAAVLEELRG
jgi:shikimate dehydrogenase